MIEILAFLILLSIIAAIVALETDDLLHAVIALGAVGFLLAIAFIFLAAPDIAIVQIGVEVISLVILIRATSGRNDAPASPKRRLLGKVIAITLVGVIGLIGVRSFTEFPEFGRSVMDRIADAPSATYLLEGLVQTGAPNIVTAVLLDFRAYDTLGEATVLFCAVLGALAILRRKARVSNDKEEDGKK